MSHHLPVDQTTLEKYKNGVDVKPRSGQQLFPFHHCHLVAMTTADIRNHPENVPVNVLTSHARRHGLISWACYEVHIKKFDLIAGCCL
ncbi:hypothetical protein AVEN_31275-1 [Araneus ventricosus]|uniref:Uncharacterized protein n=1 Tax=Araneus ventricosus TaxID=182803 RepID=A0A4Y2NIV3_ARAVE|nr:hypothetical protein AVEN_31275-1 [Araneus ventricosus]